MFAFQVNSMRRTITKLVKHKRPPNFVHVMQEHADYLGCPYTQTKSIHPPGFEQDYAPGKKIGSVVQVRLIDMYKALRNAKGIDEQDESGSGGVLPAFDDSGHPKG